MLNVSGVGLSLSLVINLLMEAPKMWHSVQLIYDIIHYISGLKIGNNVIDNESVNDNMSIKLLSYLEGQ